MNSKSLLIAIAAFAVTTTGAQAFGGLGQLQRAGLSPNQIVAFEEARELRSRGKDEEARDVLLGAGVDEEALLALRKAAVQNKRLLHEAVMDRDYPAFKNAIVDSPLKDIITTEADFLLFCEAHDLKVLGQTDEAKKILLDLGVDSTHDIRPFRAMHHGAHEQVLTAAQRDALYIARQANDSETVWAILDEAGVTHFKSRASQVRQRSIK